MIFESMWSKELSWKQVKNVSLQKFKALIEPSVSIFVIEKSKEYDESKKPLKNHLRCCFLFATYGETINIPVHFGELQTLNWALQELNDNKKAIDLKSKEIGNFNAQIALENSCKQLSILWT